MGWERKRAAGLGGQRAARAVDVGARLPKDIAEALRKARRLSVGEGVQWADAALSTIGRNIHDYRMTANADFLRAAQSDAAALYACLLAASEGSPVEESFVIPGAAEGVARVRQG